MVSLNKVIYHQVANTTAQDYIVYMTYDLHGQWDYQKSTAE